MEWIRENGMANATLTKPATSYTPETLAQSLVAGVANPGGIRRHGCKDL